MRTTRYAILASLCVAVQFSTAARAADPAATVTPGAAAKPSWTQRIAAPFKKNPFASFKPKPSANVTKADPAEKPFDPSKASPELFVGLAQMSQRSGNIPQARQLYQKALAKAPNHREALLGAARMEDREGQLDVALMLYQRAAAAHPQDATALNDLALCHARRNELPQAHQILEQAIRLDAKNPRYRNNVAKVLVQLNAINPAMQHLSAVHAPAVANYNMAVLLTERGRQDEANYFLAQALTIDPQMEPAHMMLASQPGQEIVVPPAIAGPALSQPTAPMLVQSGPQAPPARADSAESILPTPEVVATVPWGPHDPATMADPTANADPAASGPAVLAPPTQMPALSPPVR